VKVEAQQLCEVSGCRTLFPKRKQILCIYSEVVEKKQSEFTLPAPETIGCLIKFSTNFSNIVVASFEVSTRVAVRDRPEAISDDEFVEQAW
jgi:uncharacterized Fe-S cluster-containing radical SAM superfamily protein